jgi:hypothetical protein
MKKYQFLLLDAGPIIKLFELGIWDAFIEKCAVTISKTVADEAKWASGESEDVRIDLSSYEQKGQIQVIDLDVSLLKTFYDQFDLHYRAEIDDGEKEILAFLCNSKEKWLACSSDHVVFRILGLVGKSDQGISLQEILDTIGLSQSRMEQQYTRPFCEKWIRKGQTDSIQGQGLH